MHSIRTIVLVSMVVLAGCRKPETSSPPGAEAKPAAKESTHRTKDSSDLAFIVAQPRVTTAAVPARFAAPLPASIEDLNHRERFAPGPYISAALAAGDPGMWQRVLTGVRQAVKEGPVPRVLAAYYSQLFGYSPTTATCEALQKLITGAEPAPVKAVFWQAFSRCQGDEYAGLLARDDAPDQVIIDWYFEHHGDQRLPFNARLMKAATGVAASGERFEVRKIGFVFAHVDEEKAIASVKALQQQTTDPERRALVALGLLRHPAPAAQALGKASCAQPKVSNDAMCPHQALERARARTPVRNPVEEAVQDSALKTAELVAKYTREAVQGALERCLQKESSDYSLVDCLERLATLDRARAVALARSMGTRTGKEASPQVRRAVHALVTYPEAGALEKRLADLGFTPAVTDWKEHTEHTLSAEVLLGAFGWTSSFDTETDQFPNEHDQLLGDLARLTKTALRDVVFEEVPPPASEMDEGPYILRAYMDGKRYELTAQNNGDWYDVEAVIGLLNALLVARHSEVRFVTLPTGDQTATVLAGPRAGLVALVKAGLIEVAGADMGMRAGKEFEEKALQHLREEGHVILPSGQRFDSVIPQ